MPFYHVPYGTGSQGFHLPEDWDVDIIAPGAPGAAGAAGALKNPEEAARQALASLPPDIFYPETVCPHLRTPGRAAPNRAASNRAASGAAGRARVAIAVNDHTRPVPHRQLLPPLLARLEDAGYSRSRITFYIATGSHEAPSEAELRQILPPDITEGCAVRIHNCRDAKQLVHLGTTRLGTPCEINRSYVESDLKIVVGNIEPHQFMGWSGGAKSAAIGLAGHKTITANHRHLTRKDCGPCRYSDNPMRMDVEQMGRMAGVHLALNVVMNSSRDITGVFAGPPETVMQQAISFAASHFTAAAGAPADLVIASPGGHPKDINLYQTQKALRHAALAAKPCGAVILAAECPSGVGHDLYQSWMKNKKNFAEVQEAYEKEEFRLGVHKAKMIADDAEGRRVYLASALESSTVRALLFHPCASVEAALEEWKKSRPKNAPSPRVLILPFANSTVPQLTLTG